ncbi:uncharacterized protein LOC107623151, partial [Arachis ipaensis]|uniref:uncharacterized protein LOC107623151 n=1 Tax=Arachis ipaensis TaxID=130454 RepID=UPI000A2AF970
ASNPCSLLPRALGASPALFIFSPSSSSSRYRQVGIFRQSRVCRRHLRRFSETPFRRSLKSPLVRLILSVIHAYLSSPTRRREKSLTNSSNNNQRGVGDFSPCLSPRFDSKEHYDFILQKFCCKVILVGAFVLRYSLNCASPAMLHSLEELNDFTPCCQALCINVGTLTPSWLPSMKSAAQLCSQLDIPWVLDPVAISASGFRLKACMELVELKPAVIRGNGSEIIALSMAFTQPSKSEVAKLKKKKRKQITIWFLGLQ